MKIWEVELAIADGKLDEKLVKADDFLEAVEKVKRAALADTGKFSRLTQAEKKTIHVVKVELYCETDVGE